MGHLPESQCGFRKNRGTIDMVFAARQLQEKCQEQNTDLYSTYVDLTKAFDTVSREGLWKIMSKYLFIYFHLLSLSGTSGVKPQRLTRQLTCSAHTCRCLQFCMSRQSQILFLSDVGIFIVHVWCATQTRPRFNVPSERRGTTTWVVHPYPTSTKPRAGLEPGTFWLGGERSTTELHSLCQYLKLNE